MELHKLMLISVLFCVLMSWAVSFYRNNPWVKCRKQRKKLKKQGIKGPSPSLLYGNVPEMQRIQSMAARSPSSFSNGESVSHDYTAALFPSFEQWRKEYGPVYTYSTGHKQHLYVNDPELMREMSQTMSLDFGKPTYMTKALAPLLGNGVLRTNGNIWARQRKIIGPQLYMDKVKAMAGLIKEAAESMLAKWGDSIEEQGGIMADVRVDEDLRATSADMLSRACFGSSYTKGKEIFLKLRTLQRLLSKQNVLFGLPTFFRILNTKVEKEMKALEKEIETLIWDAVQARVQECTKTSSSEKDLLQWILDGATNDQDLSKESSKALIVDNCKNIYFAGHESTAVSTSWCLMLLALHPEWQDHIRAEVNKICQANGGSDILLDFESLLKLKSVTMVIQEALRLYSPAAFISREALEDFKMGNLVVPKGVCIWSVIPALHRQLDIWGPDANEFKPHRFANGVSSACKVPQAYVPFGIGPRLCVGKNFAMVELKILLCLIVSKFSFSLSPQYKHSPAYRMIIEPLHGVHIRIKRI